MSVVKGFNVHGFDLVIDVDVEREQSLLSVLFFWGDESFCSLVFGFYGGA